MEMFTTDYLTHLITYYMYITHYNITPIKIIHSLTHFITQYNNYNTLYLL